MFLESYKFEVSIIHENCNQRGRGVHKSKLSQELRRKLQNIGIEIKHGGGARRSHHENEDENYGFIDLRFLHKIPKQEE